MTTTLKRARDGSRSKAARPAPAIREVCLVGDRARRYIHIALDGLGTEASERSEKRRIETG
jgi:hypothetical protein